jgi:hypothetical protein
VSSPEKQDIPKELWRVANTLTQEAQEAAMRRCKELAFDINKGRISLEETLINLSHARDVILDAVDKSKITQLPLKLQSSLLDQLRLAGEELTSITNGKDASVPLEAAVEDLTASIWNYQLHSLSGEVLGYQSKMNQLKAEEVLIRRVSREAGEFIELKDRASALLKEIATAAESTKTEQSSLQESVKKIADTLQQCNETQQKVSALAAQVQQNEITTTQQVASVSQSAANVQAAEKSIKDITADISRVHSELTDLLGKTQQLISGTETTTQTQIEAFKTGFNSLKVGVESRTSELTTKVEGLILDAATRVSQTLDAANADILKSGTGLENRIAQMSAETKSRLDQGVSTQQVVLDGQLKEFSALHQNAIASFNETVATNLKTFLGEKDDAMSENKAEFERRVKELDELEGQIRKSIERATGFTLFHSFQKRQLDLGKEKRFWAYALGVTVLISLCASGFFIYSLKYVQAYNAAFYLKLSISIPLIYAIAFCNIQYSRERRLEEEYAFKSNISVSLDPYQRLVRELVDVTKPEELAKYTAFVIDSVSKVFTSPTKVVFGEEVSDVNTLQKLLKALGDFAEPFVKGLTK